MDKKLDYCLRVTGDCLQKARVKPEGNVLLRFARDYYNDALHYKDSDPETALEAAAYAHGFIDAGVLLGLIEIDGYHLEKQ